MEPKSPTQPSGSGFEPQASREKAYNDLYPERRGEGHGEYTTWEKMTGKNLESVDRGLCQDNVLRCMQNFPMVKTMLGALQSVGCPIDLKRHVLCDICTPGSDVMINHGGYDRENNQIFICANNANSKGKVHAVLVQNLVHMFDRCVSKVDYGNPDHLACTEIRKFNLASCALITNLKRSDATFAVKGEHPNCVRNSAVESLVKTQYLDQATAEAAVDRVFDRCYRDMEPYGRRSKSPKDFDLMANERYLFGYY